MRAITMRPALTAFHPRVPPERAGGATVALPRRPVRLCQRVTPACAGRGGGRAAEAGRR